MAKVENLEFGDVLMHRKFSTTVMVIVKRQNRDRSTNFAGLLVDVPPTLKTLMETGEMLDLNSNDWDQLD